MERFNPLNDYLFLKVMGEEGDEEQCLAFLNAVLSDSSEKPLRLVKILENRSVSAENLGDKSVAFAFRAIGETETQKNIKAEIEVQLKDLHNMTERTLYYWAREYAAGIKEGEDYSGLPRVITINIVNFDHIKLEKFHTAFRLREDSRRDYVLTDVMEIHFVNMVKFRKKTNKQIDNTLERWLMFLDEYATPDTLAEIVKIDPAIAKAQMRLEAVTANEEFRQNYELRRKALSDWTTGVNTAFERGVEKGAEKERFEIAGSALAKGLSVDFIQDLTGLKIEDIIALQNKK
ncbi:MAG: Rpn family recombination-promoting nuclease/putative transposase [Treponema sp.]|jgi:predicted transposase/invertase (TIGR01784 family)|nr:Rpn family recombination-promoting nuclease/putative transposase [Treponema sp.]